MLKVAYNVDDPAWKATYVHGSVAPSLSILQDWLTENQLSFVTCSETSALGPLQSISIPRASAATRTDIGDPDRSAISSTFQWNQNPTSKPAVNTTFSTSNGIISGSTDDSSEAADVEPLGFPAGTPHERFSPRLFRPDVEYSLILGSMDTANVLHGSSLNAPPNEGSEMPPLANAAASTARGAAVDESDRGIDLSERTPDESSTEDLEVFTIDELTDELPLHVTLTLKSIGDMDYWMGESDLPRSLSIGLRSPGGGLYEINNSSGIWATGGVLKSPGIAAAEHACLTYAMENDTVKSGDSVSYMEADKDPISSSDQPTINTLPSRFRCLSRSQPTVASSSFNHTSGGQDIRSGEAKRPSSASLETSAPSASIGASSVGPTASNALSSILESLGRLLPLADSDAETPQSPPTVNPCALVPPVTSIPWLAADDLESGFRYISLQVSHQLM